MIREFNVVTGVETTRDYTTEELAEINDPVRVKEDTNANIRAQIMALESTITPRRLRDALLSGSMQFIQDVEDQIDALRSQL